MRPETRAIHAAHETDPRTGALAQPMILSTTFARDEDYALLGPDTYSRHSNPNRAALEKSLAGLEGGHEAVAFSSGMGAINAMFQTLQPGDHVIVPADCYVGMRSLINEHLTRWGVRFSNVDMNDTKNIERALRIDTRLVWLETPSNPCMMIADIRRAAELAHVIGAQCVVDSTFATPFCQKPFEHGADIVMHSTTKYFGGHNDVTGGALIFKSDTQTLRRARSLQGLGGAVPSPFDCWMLSRSIPSMPQRMRTHIENAGAIAAYLSKHPKVASVHYPGLPSHPNHELAKRQMTAFGGMLSFEPHGGAEAALRVTRRVNLFKRATSLGGFVSLIDHRATVEGEHSVCPPALLRCAIGLEHVDDLIEDLEQALDG
jgi:cystathionine gamma-synthase